MHAAIHAGGERVTLQAMPAKLAPSRAASDGPRLCDRLRRQRGGTQPGAGEGLACPGQFGPPNAPEYLPVADAGGRQPAFQHAHWT